MPPSRPSWRIRPMTLDDLPQIAEIERESFSSVWPASAYRRELTENKLASYSVAERPDQPATVEGAATYLAGFIGVWFMVDEAHIITIAVRDAERRRGVGEGLLLAAFDQARAKGVPALTLECRVSNVAARALYAKYGFSEQGVRKRYYTDNDEDALILTTPSLEDAGYWARLQSLRHELGEA